MKNYGTYWHYYVFDENPEKIENIITESDLLLNNQSIHVNIFENAFPQDQKNILFIHGTAVYSRFYAEFLYRLCKKGYRIIAPDMPGHGLSEGERGHFTMSSYLSVISGLIDHIQETYGNQIAIMGSSLGGITALYAITNEDNRLNGAICHNAAIFNEDAHKKIVNVKGILKIFKPIVPFLAKIAPKLKVSVWTYLDPYKLGNSKKFHQTIDKFLEDSLLADKYTLTALKTQMKAPLPKPIEEVKSPIMVINGENDALFSENYMREIYNRITCSQKRLEIIPHASHLIFQEHIDESIKRITSFLEDIFS